MSAVQPKGVDRERPSSRETGAIAAGFVQGLSGFGFALVAMSFWAWSLEPRLAAALAVFGALTGQIIAAATVRRGFDSRPVSSAARPCPISPSLRQPC